MTNNSTRKQFFAKLLGVVATASLLPKVFAKSASSAAPATRSGVAAAPTPAFEFRHDSRSVARRGDTV